MLKKTKREEAIAALLNNPTVKTAAESMGISERSLYDIMRRDNFREELEQRRRQLAEASCTALQARIGEATEILTQIMMNPVTPAQARVAAAKTIIGFALRSIEILDILPRLEALEEAEAIHRR